MNVDCFAVYQQLAVLGSDFALESAMHRVILYHIHHVIQVDKGIVDPDDLEYIRLGNRRTEDQTANAAKSVDANFNRHSTTS